MAAIMAMNHGELSSFRPCSQPAIRSLLATDSVATTGTVAITSLA